MRWPASAPSPRSTWATPLSRRGSRQSGASSAPGRRALMPAPSGSGSMNSPRWWRQETSPARWQSSRRTTCCLPSADGSAPRRFSVRAHVSSAESTRRWPSATWNDSSPIGSVSRQRTSRCRWPPQPASGWPLSVAAPPGSPALPTWPVWVTRSRCSRHSTSSAECCRTGYRNTGSPGRSSATRSRGWRDGGCHS